MVWFYASRIPPPPASPPTRCALALALLLAGCSSVPGETMTSRGVQSDVRQRLLERARNSDPQCRQPRVTNTEVIDVHSDGRPAGELWSLDVCGKRVDYLVSFPAKKGPGFSVREDR